MDRDRLADALAGLEQTIDSPDPETAAAAVRELSDAITTADVDAATAAAIEGCDRLRKARRFESMLRIAEAAGRAGSRNPRVTRLYAQALIEQGLMTAALRTLEDARQQPGEEAGEIDGLIGRAHKQRYVDQPPSSASRLHIRSAIDAYLSRYHVAPADNLWHGINAVAMLARAQRDGYGADDDPDWNAMAREVLSALEARPAEARMSWDHATEAETLVALGRFGDAAGRLTAYASAAGNDAFAYASTLRQFRQIWQLDDKEPTQRALLEFLEARLLRGKGGQLEVAAPAAKAQQLHDDADYLEAVFGSEEYKSVRWYRAGLEAAKSVVRINRPLGATIGTGFVLPGAVLHAPWGDALVVVTNFHVANRGAVHPGHAPSALRLVVEDGGPEIPIAEILWESKWCALGTNPPLGFDTAVLRAALPPTVAPSYAPSADPVPAADQRVYVIGYPLGQDLSFSLQDNHVVGANETTIHYRAPTRPGSSGSPVFDEAWQLVGIHHGGGERVARLDDPHASYAANEGFVLGAIRAAIEQEPP